jgi:hypothetical protein
VTTGATWHAPLSELSSQCCVPLPQVSLQGNSAGGTWHIDHLPSMQVRVPSPQVFLQDWV